MVFSVQWPSTPQRALFLPILLKALVTLSSALQATPRLRALESDVCRTHYRIYDPTVINPSSDSVPEELCKIAQVQTDLVYLLGWDAFFQNVPGQSVHLPRWNAWRSFEELDEGDPFAEIPVLIVAGW